MQVRQLKKSYHGQNLLREISFHLPAGRILGILGPNGAGKTTLLKILALVSKPEEGEVWINGTDAVSGANRLRPLIGYVPQEIALYDDLTVADNLLCWSRKRHALQSEQFHEISEALDLEPIIRKKVRELSGGMKRRVNLAVALLNEPALLIMDEPLVGVDILQRKKMIQYLHSLAQRGMTQVISSHYPDEIRSLVDEIMILDHGKIQYHRTMEEFLILVNDRNHNMDETILNLMKQQEES